MSSEELSKYNINMPMEQIKSLKNAFDLFDRDGSGQISGKEIYKIMKSIGCSMKMAEIKEIISRLDKDENAEIDFPEFCQFSEIRQQIVEEKHKAEEKEKEPPKEEELPKEEEEPPKEEEEIPKEEEELPEEEEPHKEEELPEEEEPPKEEEEMEEPEEDVVLRASKPSKKKEESQSLKFNEEEEDPVIRAFMYFDKEKEGKLKNSEFRRLLEKLGHKFSSKFVDKVFNMEGLDDEGYCNYRLFVKNWRERGNEPVAMEEAIKFAQTE